MAHSTSYKAWAQCIGPHLCMGFSFGMSEFLLELDVQFAHAASVYSDQESKSAAFHPA